ncbi:helix-turn-helix domain-containing protein [Pedobacter sp. ASV28]|uniref:helix-turn-helix domain-containing protein n=1 Tax=Pedobacter sp. ASV28 TaxID=2795123 RepID=UPI0018EABF71|nr:helix-turn-helix domain-containing protein [Pedobacter sp. ASV28]
MQLHIKNKSLFGLMLLWPIILLCAGFSLSPNNDFDLAKQELLFRKIGHEILWHAGDSTSRVLPVKKIAGNEYQIRFENEFTFQPDSLVKIIRSALLKDHQINNYIVNVLNCSGKEVVFGYAIAKEEKNDIVPCSGRPQPKGCYLVSLKFQKAGMSLSQKDYLMGGIPLLAFVGLLFFRFGKMRGKQVGLQPAHKVFKIGNTLFEVEKRSLVCAETTTVLTAKESKLLLIFAKSPNTIIERGRLQKEIWEDEGVIVGRSLDMFISKLRKKLEGDLSVQLINIHGKGYKLQTAGTQV